MSDRKLAIYTHHKCGSMWLLWVLRRTLYHNGIDFFRSHRGDAVPALDRRISVLINANFPAIKEHMCSDNIHFIRNPLSILSSAYYSHLTTHPTEGWEELNRQRRILHRCERTEGILVTLAFLHSPEMSPQTPGPFAALLKWDYDDPRVKTVRMEDAVISPKKFVDDVLALAGIDNAIIPDTDRYNFERFTGRQIGQIDPLSHFRSGDPEGWRKELPGVAVDFIRNEFRTFLEKFYPAALSD